uniref:Putative odorant receptor 54 n=1 Tax=Conopomorpha sinensis TaxID=940481 RepID=A0A3S7SGL1_9NEOP|nr:putative odorant receptor 54 [Conopomorpha sinensis]
MCCPLICIHRFIFMYIYSSLSLTLVGMCDTSVNYVVAALLILASAQLDVLSRRLRALGGRRGAHDDVVDCVKHHQHIIEFVKELSSIFRLPIFFQIVISSIVLCMAVYKISVTNEPVELITMIFYLICVLLELMMYCYPGDLLMNKSLAVSEAAYSGDWVNCDLRTRKMLLLMIMRSQRPMVINAGGVYKLCLPTAATVVQTSYSYYAMLKQTAN